MNPLTRERIASTSAIITEHCAHGIVAIANADEAWDALPDERRTRFMEALTTDVATLIAEVVKQAVVLP